MIDTSGRTWCSIYRSRCQGAPRCSPKGHGGASNAERLTPQTMRWASQTPSRRFGRLYRMGRLIKYLQHLGASDTFAGQPLASRAQAELRDSQPQPQIATTLHPLCHADTYMDTRLRLKVTASSHSMHPSFGRSRACTTSPGTSEATDKIATYIPRHA